ncbi:MAG: SprT-like domain-containing protein [Cyclobacteriaceae bacterium]
MNQWPLARHLPAASLHYCYELWKRGRFSIKLTASRKSKLGDYSFDRRTGDHVITLNRDLNAYEFLLTYLHEVAHYAVTVNVGLNVKPHGPEWKAYLRRMVQPMLDQDVFPSEVAQLLRKHLRSPKASARSDIALSRALQKYDSFEETPPVYLEALRPGDRFEFNNQVYEKREDRRTRVLCKLIPSGRLYLISKAATVQFLSEGNAAVDQGAY